MRLDGVRIEADDFEQACERYASLLGVAPVVLEDGVRRYQLARGAVELAAGEAGRATVLFTPEAPDDRWPVDPAAYQGLPVAFETRTIPPSRPGAIAAVEAIDHVVVFTPNPARAIALWRDQRGLRLAFDREFPERKVRLLFFRSGGITLELASALPAPADADGIDRFYGVSYRVPDLASRRAALLAAGFDVSDMRPGNKAGTRVASVRAGTAGVPTLLLEESVR
jgi:catechol 2,3-dioxygenase-like lactoylglutathione lyase family enzyme